MMPMQLQDIDRTEVLDQIEAEFGPLLGANDRAFLRRTYATPRDTYVRRLQAIGFWGLESVLDAGCGFGQWTLELAGGNQRASAIDVRTSRLMILRELSKRLGIDTIEPQQGRLERLPYDDGAFDAVFCYSSLQYTDWRSVLLEFRRVLKPGGLLYTTGNGLGWYLRLWTSQPNAVADYDPREVVAQTFRDTTNYERFGTTPSAQLIIDPEHVRQALEEGGLDILGHGGDGTVSMDPDIPLPKPFFEATYCGNTGCYEFLSQKRRV